MKVKRLMVIILSVWLVLLNLPYSAYASPEDTGASRTVIAKTEYGIPGRAYTGDLVRVEVFEPSLPGSVTGGTVRIKSSSTGYDSKDQLLFYERDGKSLYYHWDTGGLPSAEDYKIYVTLNGSSLNNPGQPDLIFTLAARCYELDRLAEVQDAFAPAPGIPLYFIRVMPNNSANGVYLGPFGRGWTHNFDIELQEFTNGRIAMHGAGGYNRWFESKSPGLYTSSPGDYGILTRDPDGSLQLKEKDGTIYRFSSNLRLNYIQYTDGNRINLSYDIKGNLVKISHSSGASFSLEYNDAGRIIRLTDQAGRITSYEYDPDNQMMVKSIDPAGDVTEYFYSTWQSYMLDYRLLSIAFPDGTHVHYEYDSLARLVRMAGTWGANPLSYRYDKDGTTCITDGANATTAIRVNDRGQIVSTVYPDGSKTVYKYDGSGNLTSVEDPLGHVTSYGYDQYGNVISVVNPLNENYKYSYDARYNQLSSITDPLKRTTSLTYDSTGNLIKTAYPDMKYGTFTYDISGNPTTYTDTLGRVTRFTYDSRGLVTQKRDALDGITRFSYNKSGDLEGVTDAKGHTISYKFDVLGQVTQVTYSDGSHEDYSYDASGKLTSYTNRRGEKFTFQYDAAGQLEWEVYPSGEKLHFQYDGRGLITRIDRVDKTGALTSNMASYEYDLSQQVTLARVPGKTEADYRDISYSYDAAGNCKSMTYPDGYGLKYEYDAASRLIRISDKSDAVIALYKYDAGNRRIQKTLGNGTYTTYEYDSMDRVKKLINYGPDSSIQSKFEYTYNGTGMVTAMTTLEGQYLYSYDKLDQLTKVTYPDGKTAEYSFDRVGNRTIVKECGLVTKYTVNNLNQYTQIGPETFEYDKDGNLKSRTLGGETTAYTWDDDSRLIGVDRGGKHIGYTYDSQGRLAAKIVDGRETRYIWDGLELIAEMDSAGKVIKRYVYGTGINEVIEVDADGIPCGEQQDDLGSVVGITDARGDAVSAYTYDVYGKMLKGGSIKVPQGFAGMWWDEDAGLYYARARWYEPKLGRFISTDPLGILNGTNLYLYGNNNPVVYLDPLGLDSIFGQSFTDLNRKFNNLNKSNSNLNSIDKAIQHTNNSLHQNNSYDPFGPGKKIPDPFDPGKKIPDPFDSGKKIPDPFGPGKKIPDPFGPGKKIPDPFSPKIKQPSFIDCFKDSYEFTKKEVIDWFKRLNSDKKGLKGTIGGSCPTFIQLPQNISSGASGTTHLDVSNLPLAGKITVPVEGALLRSDIPIFGVAGGTDFKEYRVEYGEGSSPGDWHLIASSITPQNVTDTGLCEIQLMQGDIDIRGNLATWNTGLKNWVHLPWHPAEDPMDLNGIYTLRLVVTGKDGETVEDRMTVEVGRAIAQPIPCTAVSPDHKVTMRFPEQSLLQPFRVFTILPLGSEEEKPAALPPGVEQLGLVYNIKEPGEKFMKDVALEFSAGSTDLKDRLPENTGIMMYDANTGKWLWLPTEFTLSESSVTFSTSIVELPSPKAIYALAYDAQAKRAHQKTAQDTEVLVLVPESTEVLYDDTFESGYGHWKTRDYVVGATLSREDSGRGDGTYALKVTNETFGGNFSVTALDQSFDAKDYPLLTFDYNIKQGVKTDLYLLINGRWYNLGFTDDAMDFHTRDVNIANLGRIKNIIADDKWHTASVNLYELLKQKTLNTKVDAIMMADWDLGGYMKLDFGRNARGAYYYIDNFKLSADSSMKGTRDTIKVDNFDAGEIANLLGGSNGVFSNEGADYCQAKVTSEPGVDGKNNVLQLTFDTSLPGSYCGYFTKLGKVDLTEMGEFSLRLHTQGTALPPLKIGLGGSSTSGEVKVSIAPYISGPDENGWLTARIPLSVFIGHGLSSLSSVDILSLTFENWIDSGKGVLLIDDAEFHRKPSCAVVADFDNYPMDLNLLGGTFHTVENGAACISSGYHEEVLDFQGPATGTMRISFGGDVGLSYGGREFSYAFWDTNLMGFDARGYKYLVLRMRGEDGGEKPNIYLDDGTTRRPVRAVEYTPITTGWQDVRIPLEKYASQGVDLSHLEALQLVFEWERMSGTIYVSKISFEGVNP